VVKSCGVIDFSSIYQIPCISLFLRFERWDIQIVVGKKHSFKKVFANFYFPGERKENYQQPG
jgi:hypothetical protein